MLLEKYTYISIFLFSFFLTISACKSIGKQDQQRARPTFCVYGNSTITEASYWYYAIKEGTRNVYELSFKDRIIVFEAEGKKFDLTNDQVIQSKLQVINTDGGRYLPEKGKVIGSSNQEELTIDIELELYSTEEDSKMERFVYQGTFKKSDCNGRNH